MYKYKESRGKTGKNDYVCKEHRLTTMKRTLLLFAGVLAFGAARAQVADIQASPELLDAPFGLQDEKNFQTPPKVFWPETWFHFIGDNVSREGIDADLEAIAAAGIGGIQWFHGAFGGRWPGVDTPVVPLSQDWDDMVAYLGQKARSLGLRLTIQTCPGWAMAGGPWVKPEDAMRDLVWSRTDIPEGGKWKDPLPKGEPSQEEWRDYRDVCVLAFPTPLGDTGKPLEIKDVVSDEADWAALLKDGKSLNAPAGTSHKVIFTVPEGAVVRTLELPSLDSFGRDFVNTPGLELTLVAIGADGKRETVLHTRLPMGSWQDNQPMSLAVNEARAQKMEFTLSNEHNIHVEFVRFSSAARKNDWQAESGSTLRGKELYQEFTRQSREAFVQRSDVQDLTTLMDAKGHLRWTAPKGKGSWTVLRFGHVNSGYKNGPAPAEATGWECNKLDPRGAEVQFANYVGRLQDGPLEGLASGMLMDSWECYNQTWTGKMEEEFLSRMGYGLREWMPALAGYVMVNQETTVKFLNDWRHVKSDLYNQNFFQHMTDLAHAKGLQVQYETAGGDVVAMDLMEYYKYADVPMTEFWQPITEGFVGDLNFKPIKPTASAAHIYGKRRVAAESFTSFELTWDEHWEMLKEVANLNMTEGVTHNVFHTYTHNPQVNFLPPGTSFGNKIGTPFLRGQTWWKYMPYFTTYLARTSYLLERGLPVVDVLWYIGDEVSHKPDQKYPFPKGYKYDYCNPDVLFNRLGVQDGRLVTPDGQAYEVLWVPEYKRLGQKTCHRILELMSQGAKVLLGPEVSAESLLSLGLQPHIQADEDVLWTHRKADGAQWFYITAPTGKDFHGTVKLKAQGNAEIWDAVTGTVYGLPVQPDGVYSCVQLDLERAGNCFVVFRENAAPKAPAPKLSTDKEISLTAWKVQFPQGWGAPTGQHELFRLEPWKDLPLGLEGQAFSGTAVYETTFDSPVAREYVLDLGEVDMIADVELNGEPLGVLWAHPYRLTVQAKRGRNILRIAVTSTWFNRLAYDAAQPEGLRKTWTIAGPGAESPLRNSGLLGPVRLLY